MGFDPVSVGMMGVAGLSNYFGTRDTNRTNAKIAQKQMDFQAQQSSTAYQRAVKDLEAAGLNPMLAYQQGGASSSAGAGFQAQNELGTAVNSAVDARRQFAEVRNLQEQNKKLKADVGVAKAMKTNVQMDSEVKAASVNQMNAALPGLLADSAFDQGEIGKILRQLRRFTPFVNSASSAASNSLK